MTTMVVLAPAVERGLADLPRQVRRRLLAWMDVVVTEGIMRARAVRGFRDEALLGKLKGLRSIRLSRSYRAIYRVALGQGGRSCVYVEKVTKHVYR